MSKRNHRKNNMMATEMASGVSSEAEVANEEVTAKEPETIETSEESAEVEALDAVEDVVADEESVATEVAEMVEESGAGEDAGTVEETDAGEEAVPDDNTEVNSAEETEDKKTIKSAETVADVRKEAARVAKNKHEREKINSQPKEVDEKREARRRRRVRNQVISYLVVVIFILVIIAAGVFAYLKFFSKNNTTLPNEGTIEVSEPTEQTENIISEMLGMEDDISEPVEEPEIIEEPEEPEDVDLLGNYVLGIIDTMTLEEKVAGIFIVTPESITGATTATVAGDATKTALEKYAVGGIVYADKNISTKDQFSTMISKTAEMVKYPTFFAIAEEGGSVGPLARVGYYDAEDAAATIAASGDITAAYSAGINIGFAMKEVGLNLNFAPVADIAVVDGNILGTRAYADSAVNTAGFVNEMMRGIEDSKSTACLKYFPGLGMVAQDPGKGRVVSERTDEEFSSGEFLVYQAAIENNAQMIMMSNVIYSAYSDVPASMSEEIVSGILRNRLGFNGVVLSGNLSDMAVSQYYGSDEAAIAALKAGCDMLLCPENFETAYNGIIQAVNDGVIDEKRIDKALERILRIKYADNFEE